MKGGRGVRVCRGDSRSLRAAGDGGMRGLVGVYATDRKKARNVRQCLGKYGYEWQLIYRKQKHSIRGRQLRLITNPTRECKDQITTGRVTNEDNLCSAVLRHLGVRIGRVHSR